MPASNGDIAFPENLRLICEVLVGSTAYNLNTPDSDLDYAGVYAAEPHLFFGISNPKESISKTGRLDKVENPDGSYYELKKFVNLALGCRPMALEMLWAPEYLFVDSGFAPFIQNKFAFLSANAVKHAYGGYAKGQIHRLLNKGDFGSDLKKRTEKHARHVARLVIQGNNLLSTGELDVRLSDEDREFCFWFGKKSEDVEEFVSAANSLIETLDKTTTSLPEKPNQELVEDLLIRHRLDRMRFLFEETRD